MSWSLEAVDLFSSRLIIMPLSGLILLGVGVWNGAPALPDRRLWGQLALTGLFNMGLFQIFLISGIATLGPSRTPIIVYTMPAWSALLAVFLLKERITLRIALSLVLSLRGRRHHHQPGGGRPDRAGRHPAHPAGGDLLRHRHRAHQARWRSRGDPTINAAWQILLGTMPVVIVWLVFARGAYFRPEQMRGLAALAWLILVSNVLAYACWFRIIRALPAAVAGLTTLVVPCIGFGSSALMTAATVSWLDVVALGADHRRRDAGARPARAGQVAGRSGRSLTNAAPWPARRAPARQAAQRERQRRRRARRRP